MTNINPAKCSSVIVVHNATIIFSLKNGIRSMQSSDNLRNSKPVIERFALKMANGYKDIEFSANHAVKILVAENGAGKTTLINTLYYLLTGNYRAFMSSYFEEFELTISGTSWSRRRSAYAPIAEDQYSEIIANEVWERLGLNAPELFEAEELVLAVASKDESQIESCRYYQRELNISRWPGSHLKASLQNVFSRIASSAVQKNQNSFSKLVAEIESALAGHTVIYLPTYRRIEASLPEYRVKQLGAKRHRPWIKRSRDTQLIHFGLQDVEQRLFQIGEEIRISTVRSFARINARTLDDLLFRSYIDRINDIKTIELESLHVVLGRLGRDNDKTRDRLQKIIQGGEIDSDENIYLRSFLDQLMETYASTQMNEESIERFIGIVNSYWDEETREKSFVFDKASAETKVVNSYTGKELPLEALSSGEKQIISIFARLYLDPAENVIMLIDEPELSLSMEWQQKFLPDVVRADACRQLIAITHSPFIFKNELRPYAGELKVQRHIKVSKV